MNNWIPAIVLCDPLLALRYARDPAIRLWRLSLARELAAWRMYLRWRFAR